MATGWVPSPRPPTRLCPGAAGTPHRSGEQRARQATGRAEGTSRLGKRAPQPSRRSTHEPPSGGAPRCWPLAAARGVSGPPARRAPASRAAPHYPDLVLLLPRGRRLPSLDVLTDRRGHGYTQPPGAAPPALPPRPRSPGRSSSSWPGPPARPAGRRPRRAGAAASLANGCCGGCGGERLVRKAAPGQQRPRGTSRGVLPASGHPRARRRLQGRDSGSGTARGCSGPRALPRAARAPSSRAESTPAPPALPQLAYSRGASPEAHKAHPGTPKAQEAPQSGPVCTLHPSPAPRAGLRRPLTAAARARRGERGCGRGGGGAGSAPIWRRREAEACHARQPRSPSAAGPAPRRGTGTGPRRGGSGRKGVQFQAGKPLPRSFPPRRGPGHPASPGTAPARGRHGEARGRGAPRAGTWGSPRPGAPRPRLRS